MVLHVLWECAWIVLSQEADAPGSSAAAADAPGASSAAAGVSWHWKDSQTLI